MPTTRTQVRLPKATHEWIVKSAAINSRSMNGEIVRMLNQVMEKEKTEQKTP